MMPRPWICTRCGYVEDAPPPGLVLRHCKGEMRPMTKREHDAARRQLALFGNREAAAGDKPAGGAS